MKVRINGKPFEVSDSYAMRLIEQGKAAPMGIASAPKPVGKRTDRAKTKRAEEPTGDVVLDGSERQD